MWQVLIADDVKMNRKLLRAALSRHCCSEWEIAECATAEAAVAEMSSTSDSRYDLVLMDDHFEVNDAHDSACMHAQHRPSAHSPQIPCAPSLSQPRTSQPIVPFNFTGGWLSCDAVQCTSDGCRRARPVAGRDARLRSPCLHPRL